ncbi:ATP-binding response regulator [Desulfonema magnum]|uniref:histidine kinase n=1 Tax=Desulfonema magnum TaxID=45655 RepID=A0A975GPN4_9BACT|nr:response regulator [Desulfonema magnum]QTA88995.1 Two component system response regulator/histidine kinase, PAS domain-containing [Desulfonema magnum]
MKKKDSANRDDAIRILVVDDEESIREGSERILRRMGCEVLKASRGDEALGLLEKEKVSIILLDLKMPGMEGMEVFRHIQEIDETILVIIITGFATVETAIEAMKQGAYDFIPKPFEPDHLRIVVGRAREKIRLTRETEKLEQERRKTLLDLDTEKSRIRTIIEYLPNGVVVTNAQGRVVLMNPAFLRHIGASPSRLPGDRIEAYVADDAFCKLVMEISQGSHTDSEEIPTYELALSDKKYLLARGRPVIGEDEECLGAVINLADITAMKVLDQLKSEFVAKVSHELRSPLSTIHEQLALVLSDVVEEFSERDQHLLSRAKEKTRGLISVIGDLLDLSRIESGVVAQEPEPVRIDDLLKNIVEFLSARADAKEQTLTSEFPEYPLPCITADPIALESIFGNLIANAINYTQNGGKIHVKADLAEASLADMSATDQRVRVQVADNGFGIDPKHQEKIFERFFRVKNEKTRYITGTGLGLPIVKGLVDSLGGVISLESEPGKGTTFTVILPAGASKK